MLLNWSAREDCWESLGKQGDQTSQSWRKSTLKIHWKDWCWNWSSSTLVAWCRVDSPEKTLMLGKTEGRKRKEWPRRRWLDSFSDHSPCPPTQVDSIWETLGDSEGQGSLECCHSWGHNELDTTEQQQDSWVLRLRAWKRGVKYYSMIFGTGPDGRICSKLRRDTLWDE